MIRAPQLPFDPTLDGFRKKQLAEFTLAFLRPARRRVQWRDEGKPVPVGGEVRRASDAMTGETHREKTP